MNVEKKIEVSYVVEGNSSPIIIRNDNRVKVYVELKFFFPKFLNYPLCILTSNKSKEELEFDRETGVVIYVEGTKTDILALTFVGSQNQHSFICTRVGAYNFITDCKKTEIKVD